MMPGWMGLGGVTCDLRCAFGEPASRRWADLFPGGIAQDSAY
jgi:hypothetical protein